MAFQVNTNVNALNATAQSTFTQTSLSSSLQKLSSGLRINSAKDDASGMAIADSLRSQANALGQAIRNTNDGMGIIQIADKAMDEQVKILDTIKTKATQAAQDGQTTTTRTAIQADINRLIESLDNIAQTTSYNGLNLLAGSFTNKEFQVGAYSNQTIRASIGATSSDKIGHVRSETMKFTATGEVALEFIATNGGQDVSIESVVISTSAGTGLGAVAEAINKNSDNLGRVRADYTVIAAGANAIAAGDVTSLTINGVSIGNITGIQENDKDNRLVQAINAYKDTTGVEASTDKDGRLVLTSTDGRAIQVRGSGMSAGGVAGIVVSGTTATIVGSLTLTKLGAGDIKVSGTGLEDVTTAIGSAAAQTTTTLRQIKGELSADIKSAIGANAGSWSGAVGGTLGAGVTTLKGAMLVMDIAESAIKQLDTIRADLGSIQQQMQSTINNITITQVNVKSAESGIREVDFASESANYSNLNILAQAGSYAMSQANTVQQNILRLLQ